MCNRKLNGRVQPPLTLHSPLKCKNKEKTKHTKVIQCKHRKKPTNCAVQ